MTAVVPIRFRYNPKTYWYSYSACEPHVNDYVLVSRDAGTMFGWVEGEPFEMSYEQERSLKAPLKPIVRVATDDDYAKWEELEDRGRAAKAVFRELIAKRGLNIKPIDVEYYLDADRAIFHFSSEERVDFRGLVRDLAAQLHVHVDMKQIGVRDEARAIGGFGHCGEVLCCVRMSNAFKPVSISMAKEQDLPLNPGKVSGACGRLMCCLRYEFEAYKDFKSRAPKMGATIKTPAGDAKVVELNAPKELVRLRMLEGDERFFVPLSGMEKDPENEQGRPCMIGEEVFAAHCPPSMLRDKQFSVPDDELIDLGSEGKKKHRRRGGKKNPEGSEARAEGASRQKDGAAKAAEGGSGQRRKRAVGSSSRSQRNRRGGGREGADQGAQAEQGRQGASGQRRKQRPGQNSSNIRNPQKFSSNASAGDSSGHARGKSGDSTKKDSAKKGNAQRRRRDSGKATTQGGGRQKDAGQSRAGQSQHRQQASTHRKPRRTSGGGTAAKSDGGASGGSAGGQR